MGQLQGAVVTVFVTAQTLLCSRLKYDLIKNPVIMRYMLDIIFFSI